MNHAWDNVASFLVLVQCRCWSVTVEDWAGRLGQEAQIHTWHVWLKVIHLQVCVRLWNLCQELCRHWRSLHTSCSLCTFHCVMFHGPVWRWGQQAPATVMLRGSNTCCLQVIFEAVEDVCCWTRIWGPVSPSLGWCFSYGLFFLLFYKEGTTACRRVWQKVG